MNVRVGAPASTSVAAPCSTRPCAAVEAELGDDGPGAGAAVGHRAARAGDGRGADAEAWPTRPPTGSRPSWTARHSADAPSARTNCRVDVRHRRRGPSAAAVACRRISAALAGRRSAERRGRARAALDDADADGRRAGARPPRSLAGGRPRTLRERRSASRALVGDPVARGRARRTAADRARAAARRDRGRGSTRRGASTAPTSRRCNAALDRVQGRGLGGPPRPASHRAGAVEDLLGGASARPRRARGVPLGPGRAVGARPARGARPRLGRPARARRRPRPRPRRPDDRARSSRARRRPAVHVGLGARRRRRTSRSSTRRRPRSASSATTPRALRAAIRDDDAAAPRARAPTPREVVGARPHPLGERRHHLRGQRAPAEPARSSTATARRRPVRGRRAQRRRRQLRRPQGARRRCASPAEITTDAKVIPALVAAPARDGRRRSTRRSARRSPSFEGSVAIARAARPPTPDRAAPRAARQRPGAVRRARPTTASSSPASRTAWSRRRDRTCASTARRWSTPATRRQPGPGRRARRARAPARSPASRAPSYDGTRAAGRRRRAADAPRSRPATSTAATSPHYLLKEITEAPASFRKTLRGKIVERDGRLDVRAAAPRRCPPTRARRGCAPGAIRRVLVIGQGTARGRRARAWRRAARRARRRPASRSRRSLATELSGFGLARRHERHARGRDQPVAAPPPTPTAPSTSRAAAARRVIAIVNRRNSDLVDKADGVLYTSDGRDVEMSVASTKAFYAQVAAGFLLAFAHRRRARRRRRRRRAYRHELLAALRELPDAMTRACSRRRARSPRPRSATRRAAATGPSSATAPTASPRTRCGSSSRSSVTSRSPATSPRTRSTSTCRPSR